MVDVSADELSAAAPSASDSQSVRTSATRPSDMPASALKHVLRRAVFAVCVLSLPSVTFAQQTNTNASTGSSTTASSSDIGVAGGPAATQAAASNSGQQLTSQNLFSTTTEGSVGSLGSNQGRFAPNQFQNAPTATGTGANTAQGGRTTTNQFRGNQNTRRGNTQNRFGGNARSRQTIRPALRLGFVPPPRPSADVTRSSRTTLQHAVGPHGKAC